MFEVIRDGSEARLVAVNVQGRVHSEERDVEGEFEPHLPPDPWQGSINVFRDRENEPGDAMRELCTLAHEVGHSLSFLKGLSGDAYRNAVDRVERPSNLTDEEKRLIMEEEALAWALGREELSETGFCEWGVYDERSQNALAIYRQKLGLDLAVRTSSSG